jgi:nucleotidyltransferase/DNA polymerase involved in DNA repair
MAYLKINTLNVEPFSIDEAFCEITGLPELYNLNLQDYIKILKNNIKKHI